jgi:enoyl-CoA hydratase
VLAAESYVTESGRQDGAASVGAGVISAAPNVLVERSDDILWVRINRAARRNALNRAVLSELEDTFASRVAGRSLKAAVLTGEGEQAFAAGGDLHEFAKIVSEHEALELFRAAHRALDAVRRFPVPVVAALNGLAVGGGAELAVACDFRVASPRASIGFIHGRLNISTGFGGGTDLMRLLGASRALLCMLRAEVLTAHEAHALGLIDEVAAEGESLEDCVDRFLMPIRRQAPQVVRACKAMAIAGRTDRTAEERLRTELDGFVATWCNDDHWAAAGRVLKTGRGVRA